MPDASVVWIAGRFEIVEPDRRLVFTWGVGTQDAERGTERVTVCFDAVDAATEVVVVHERIASMQAHEGHQAGWLGCLDGLAAHCAARGQA